MPDLAERNSFTHAYIHKFSRRKERPTVVVLGTHPLQSAACFPQINFFRGVNAANIQRVVRGMQARQLFRRLRAQAIVQRWLSVVTAKTFVNTMREAARIRTGMRRKNVRDEALLQLQQEHSQKILHLVV